MDKIRFSFLVERSLLERCHQIANSVDKPLSWILRESLRNLVEANRQMELGKAKANARARPSISESINERRS